MGERENNNMVWIETPLSKFGFKCVMSKHDVCADPICECLCHEATFDLSLKKENSLMSVNENVTWFS